MNKEFEFVFGDTFCKGCGKYWLGGFWNSEYCNHCVDEVSENEDEILPPDPETLNPKGQNIEE